MVTSIGGAPRDGGSAIRSGPPDGGWGWMVVLGGAIHTFVNGGLVRSFTLIFEYMRDRFQSSAQATAWVYATSVTITLMSGPISSMLATKFSPRKVIMAGGLFATIGVIGTAFAPSLTIVYIFYGLIMGIGNGMIQTPKLIALSQWFDKRRARATSLTLMTDGFGSIVLSAVLTACFGYYGYSGTLLILAGFVSHLLLSGMLSRTPDAADYRSANHSAEQGESDDSLANQKTGIDYVDYALANQEDELEKTPICTSDQQSQDVTHGIHLVGSHNEETSRHYEMQVIDTTKSLNGSALCDSSVKNGDITHRDHIASNRCHHEGSKMNTNLADGVNGKVTNVMDNGTVQLQEIDLRKSISANDVNEKSENYINIEINSTQNTDHIHSDERNGVISNGHANETKQDMILNCQQMRDSLQDEDDVLCNKGSTSRHPAWTNFKSSLVRYFDYRLMGSGSYLAFSCMMACGSLCFSMSNTHLAGLAKERSLTATDISLLLAIMGGVNTATKFSSGFLFDLPLLRPVRTYLFSSFGILLGLVLICAPASQNVASFYLVWILYMILAAVVGTQESIILSDLVSKSSYGSAVGLSRFFRGFGVLVGPTFGGFLKDSTGIYDYTYYFGGTTILASTVIFLITMICTRHDRRQTNQTR